MNLRPLLILILLAPVAPAQQEITEASKLTQETLHTWLHGTDPRLIAWAATLARINNNAPLLAEMPAVLDHWTLPTYATYSLDEPQHQQLRAAQAVLDALIQTKTPVPVSTLKAIAPFFTTHTLILAARLPISETRSQLHTWARSTSPSYSGGQLARVATMLLAKQPDRNIVKDVLAESEEDLQIVVSNTSDRRMQPGYSGCGDYLGTPLAPQWPQVFTYDLVENDTGHNVLSLVKLGDDSIDARRFEENQPWGSCYAVQWLNAVTRHRILAYWLGVTVQAMPWHASESRTIVWTNRANFERELGALVTAENRKLDATVKALAKVGSGEPADLDFGSMLRGINGRGNDPRLVVDITCAITPCPLDAKP